MSVTKITGKMHVGYHMLDATRRNIVGQVGQSVIDRALEVYDAIYPDRHDFAHLLDAIESDILAALLYAGTYPSREWPARYNAARKESFERTEGFGHDV